MTDRKHQIESIYNPDRFNTVATQLVAELKHFFEISLSETSPALPSNTPKELRDFARTCLSERKTNSYLAETDLTVRDRFQHLSQKFLETANHLHSKRNMGHQVSPSIPLAGLFETLGTLSNQGMAIYEMGPFSSAVERALVEYLGEKVSYPKGFDGIATHGGSLANLTAVLAVRNVKYEDSWNKGITGRPALITGGDSHYSVARSAGILGIGTDQVIKTPLDAQRRICPERLDATVKKAKEDGYDPFCIVASTCSTPIGAFDPVDDISEVAKKHGIWLHVDGAHGASVLFSKKHRHLVKGINKADSIVWDAHKMLFTPSLCTFLLYKNGRHSFEAFKQSAPYLFDPESSDDIIHFDSALRTVECTKRSFNMSLFGVLSTYGPSLLEDMIDETIENARVFHDLLQEADDFTPLHSPQANILCFRHTPSQEISKNSEFQQALRRRVLESERFYITMAKIDGEMALRVALMNPLSDKECLLELMELIRDSARKIV